MSGKTLFRHLASYTALTLLTRAIGFLLLPVYTRAMTPADYGLLQLVEMTMDVAGIALVAGTTAGFQRYFLADPDTRAQSGVITGTMALLLAQSAIGGILLFSLSDVLATAVLKDAAFGPLLRIAGINFFVQAIPTVPLLAMQSNKEVGFFSVLSFGKALLQAGLNVLLLLPFALGPRAFLISTLVANTLLGAISVWWVIRRYRPSWSPHGFRALVKFGGPYRLTTIGNFVLTFGDRYFLQLHHGASTVGLYGLGYQFGFLVSQIGEMPFMNAWTPARYEGLALSREERDTLNARDSLAFVIVMTTMAVGIATFAEPLIMVMASPEFGAAARVIPILAFSYVIAGVTGMLKFGIDASTQTRYFTFATWISVVVMVAAYALLIPKFGAMGAAWATLIGFIARLCPTAYWASRLYPMRYPVARMGLLLLLGVSASMVTILTAASTLTGMLVHSSAAFLLYVSGLWVMVLQPGERAQLRSLVQWPSMRSAVR